MVIIDAPSLSGRFSSVTLDSGEQPILLVDQGTSRVVDCNAQALGALHTSRSAITGRSLETILRRTAARFGPVRPTDGQADTTRWVFDRPDGTGSVFLVVEAAGIHAGDAVRLLTLIDVTDWDRRTDELRQERSFLEQVVKTIPAAVFVKDAQDEGRYVLCTAPAAALSKVEGTTLLGVRDVDVLAPDVAETLRLSDTEVLTSGKMLVSEATVCRPDGRVLITETKKMAIPESAGPPRYILGITEDITARRELEMRLAWLAMRDSLTGLANRSMFRERLRHALTLRQQSGGLVVLHSLDLDHFKGVNDTLGHAAGDAILVEVANRIESVCNGQHTAARLGGDEFAIIQGPITSIDEAIDLASRISRSLNHPMERGGIPLVIGSSAGLAIAPEHGDDPDSLLRSADMALYGSKEHGRGSYRFFDHELSRKMQLRNHMEEDLREALGKHQFELCYQPIIEIATNLTVGHEALLRWNHPTRGSVSPSIVIPVAEESGLIVHLGEWILQEACREAAGWSHGRVSVNLSSVQFRSPGLAESVEKALVSSGLPAERLELEITESVLLTDSRANLETLHQLRRLGVRISLDDFGTGYSSLGYLSAFPFHKIKIDRSLVRDVSSTVNGLAIVRSVIKLAQDLGMSTTAEGVELEEQLDTLRREGCTEAQGFFFDMPQSAAKIRPGLSGLPQNAKAA